MAVSGFRTFLELEIEAFPTKISDRFGAGFYVHIESAPFMGGKKPKDKPSQVLLPYRGDPASRQVVTFTWQEIIESGVATELQIRRVLRLNASKRIPRRRQHFISSNGFLEMMNRCNKVISYHRQRELEMRSNELFAVLQYDFGYNSLHRARNMVVDNGLISTASKYSRSSSGNKCIDHVDRLGLAYVHNNRPFLMKVAAMIREYSIGIASCLRGGNKEFMRNMYLDERDRITLVSPVGGPSITPKLPNATTLAEVVRLFREIRNMAEVVLGVDIFEVLARLAMSQSGRVELGAELCEALESITHAVSRKGVESYLEAAFPPMWKTLYVMETAGVSDRGYNKIKQSSLVAIPALGTLKEARDATAEYFARRYKVIAGRICQVAEVGDAPISLLEAPSARALVQQAKEALEHSKKAQRLIQSSFANCDLKVVLEDAVLEAIARRSTEFVATTREQPYKFLVCVSVDASPQLGRMTNTVVFSIKDEKLCRKSIHSPENVFLLGFVEADETLDILKLTLPGLQESIEELTRSGIQLDLRERGGELIYLQPEFHYAADLANLWQVMRDGSSESESVAKFSCPFCKCTSKDIKSCNGNVIAAARELLESSRDGNVLGIPYLHVHFCPLHGTTRVAEKLLKMLCLAAANHDLGLPVGTSITIEKDMRELFLQKLETLVVHATERQSFFIDFKTREQMTQARNRATFDANEGETATGPQPQSRYVEIPTLTGVQASKLFGWVYDAATKRWVPKTAADGRPPYVELIEYACGTCRCSQIAQSQRDAIEKYDIDTIAYERYLSEVSSHDTAPRSKRGRMIDIIEKPVIPPCAWTPVVRDDSSTLRKALAYLFNDDQRVTWETTNDPTRPVGYVENTEGLKTPVDATICTSCLTTKLFEVYSTQIFPAIMPSTPEFLRKANVAFDSEEGIRLTRNFKHDAFGFQLLFASLYGWEQMTPYLHIIGVHAAEFIKTFGSVGLWSQGAFEAAHKLFRSQMKHTSHDGGRNGRSKITRDLASLQALHADLRGDVDDTGSSANCALQQALLRVLRYQMFDTRYAIEQDDLSRSENLVLSTATQAARCLLALRYADLDAKLPQQDTVAKRSVKQLLSTVTPEVQDKTKKLLEQKVESSRNVRRRLSLTGAGVD